MWSQFCIPLLPVFLCIVFVVMVCSLYKSGVEIVWSKGLKELAFIDIEFHINVGSFVFECNSEGSNVSRSVQCEGEAASR
jgi:hypothetical protein